MGILKNELRLLNRNSVILVSVGAVTYFDEANMFDEGETFYIHPLTGSQCETIKGILVGWADQNEEEQEAWEKLVEQIQSDRELSYKIFNLDIIEYYV